MSEQLDRLKQAQAARRQTLAQWRESQLHELSLPSGMTVFVRDVTMTDLMFTGKLPDAMLDMADEASKSNQPNIDLKKLARNGVEFKALMDALCILCVVEPPIAEKADDEHISIDELNADDKMAIFNWVNREVETMRPFRDETQPVASVQPGEWVRLEAEPVLPPGNGTGPMDAG